MWLTLFNILVSIFCFTLCGIFGLIITYYLLIKKLNKKEIKFVKLTNRAFEDLIKVKDNNVRFYQQIEEGKSCMNILLKKIQQEGKRW